MSLFINVPGIKTLVNVTSINEIKSMSLMAGKATANLLLKSGGFVCCNITQAAIDGLPNLGVYSEAELAELAATPIGPMIQCMEDYVGLLTQDEFKAILYHEDAHAINGDIMNVTADGQSANDVNQELLADAYAASIIGPELMISALTNSIAATLILMESVNPLKRDFDDVYNTIINNPDLVERLAALRAMIK